VFVGVFLLWCLLTLLSGRFRETWRASAALSGAQDHEVGLDRPTPNGKLHDDEHAREGGSVAALQTRIRASGP
jgi:hypothetical protein